MFMTVVTLTKGISCFLLPAGLRMVVDDATLDAATRRLPLLDREAPSTVPEVAVSVCGRPKATSSIVFRKHCHHGRLFRTCLKDIHCFLVPTCSKPRTCPSRCLAYPHFCSHCISHLYGEAIISEDSSAPPFVPP